MAEDFPPLAGPGSRHRLSRSQSRVIGPCVVFGAYSVYPNRPVSLARELAVAINDWADAAFVKDANGALAFDATLESVVTIQPISISVC
jgi:hypothetical protein